MQSARSIVSTASQAVSFSGASPRASMTRWSLDLPDDGTASRSTSYRVTGPLTISLDAGPWGATFDLPETTAAPHDFRSLIERIHCLALVCYVPSEGLPEIREALCRAIQHYQSILLPVLPLTGKTAGAPARAGKLLARPPLTLDDD